MRPFWEVALIFSPVVVVFGSLWAFLAWDDRRARAWLGRKGE